MIQSPIEIAAVLQVHAAALQAIFRQLSPLGQDEVLRELRAIEAGCRHTLGHADIDVRIRAINDAILDQAVILGNNLTGPRKKGAGKSARK